MKGILYERKPDYGFRIQVIAVGNAVIAGDNAQDPTGPSIRTASKSMRNGGSRIAPREKSRIQLTRSMNGQ